MTSMSLDLPALLDWFPGISWISAAIALISAAIAFIWVVPRNWIKDLLKLLLPPPSRVILAIKNLFHSRSVPSDKMRVVLSWLEADTTGEPTATVAGAFRNVRGVEMVRSAQIVQAPDSAQDEWSSRMRNQAQDLLSRFSADLAVVGTVEDRGNEVSLYFVPILGDGTLTRGDKPYTLRGSRKRRSKFRKHFPSSLDEQIVITALSATSLGRNFDRRDTIDTPLIQKHANNIRDRILDSQPEHTQQEAQLNASLALAMTALGDRTGELDDFHNAVRAFEVALDLVDEKDKNYPIWYTELANTLLLLADHQTYPDRRTTVRQAIAACQRAIKVASRENDSWIWANAQHTLGVALASLQLSYTHVDDEKQALQHFDLALEVFSKVEYPFSWAATNLWRGKVALAHVLYVARRTDPDQLPSFDTDTLRTWVELFQKAHFSLKDALDIFSPSNAPVFWAEASMLSLDYQFRSVDVLKRIVAALTQSLDLHIRKRSPLKWAEIQSDLGHVLVDLYERELDLDLLNRAVDACQSALSEQTVERVPWSWWRTQMTLGRALLALGKRSADTTRFDEAICAYESTMVLTNETTSPEVWAEITTAIGEALVLLGQCRDGTPRLQEAVSSLQRALDTYDKVGVYSGQVSALATLCDAYAALADIDDDPGPLKEAVAQADCLARALISTNRSGNEVARLKGSLGEALVSVSLEVNDTPGIERGLEVLREALDALSDPHSPRLDAVCIRLSLATAYFTRVLTGEVGPEELELVSENIIAAQKVVHPELNPFEWVAYVHILASSALLLPTPEDELTTAEKMLDHALTIFSSEQAPLTRAATQMMRGLVLQKHASLSHSSVQIQNAVAAFAAAADGFPEELAPSQHTVAVAALQKARNALAELQA